MASLDRPYAVGLILMGAAAGAPFLPKLTEVAKGDHAFSIGLMLLLIVGSVAFMPLALPVLFPGLAVEPWPLLRPLLFTMLLPLAAGMAVQVRSERWATRLRPAFALVSNVSLVLVVVLLVAQHFRAMLGTFGSGAVTTAVVFVALSTAAGYALGGPSPRTRSVLALGTGQRNVAAALLIATQNFATEPGVAVMLIAATLAGLVVLVPVARWCGRRSPAEANPGELPANSASVAPINVVAEERTP